MTKQVNQAIKTVIGSAEDRSFEQMLFIGISVFGFVMCVTTTMLNIFNTLYFQAVITSSLIVLCGVVYYFARFRKQYFFLFSLIFTAFAICVAYFNEMGIHGPIPFFFIVLFVFAFVYNPLKWHFTIFFFLTSALCAVFFIEYMFPKLVGNPFGSEITLRVHLLLGIMFCVVLSFISIYFLRKSFDNERNKNQQQKELLEKSAYQKSMFFINLSHEIKTPLTLVENYLDKYISRKGEDEELTIMRQNIQKMRRDILDYLNFENLERGRISYEKLEVLSLSALLEEKVDLFIVYAKNKGIILRYHIEPGLCVKVNLKGIEQVLNNLLENAVKYTPEPGEINVSLKQENNNIKLVVQNSGVVIPDDQLPHLFEPFYQLSREKLNAQGIGMGLYTVKKVLDNTGGQIQVSSNIEQGVVFSVWLPLSAAGESIEQQAHIPIAPNIQTTIPKVVDSAYSIKKLNLLVVEDQNDLLSYLVGELQGNYNVFVADNGVTALERLESMPVPELIISDIMMDKMDGYELLEKTLAHEKFDHIPFIFLTAKDTSKEKISGLELGALDFITKPFSIDELKMKIKTIISQKERISQAAIREVKKQFTEIHVSEKQKNDELLNANTLKYKLTAREKEIVTYIRQGLKYEDIGVILHISEHTVTRHVQNIYQKTEATTKIALIDKMYRNI